MPLNPRPKPSFTRAQETLRRYTVVPMITRRAAADDVIAGMRVPEGAYLAVSLQTVHALWAQPSAWRPERHLPGGEYDAFDADIRPYMARPRKPYAPPQNPKTPRQTKCWQIVPHGACDGCCLQGMLAESFLCWIGLVVVEGSVLIAVNACLG